jgi:hypothetical protein
MSPPAGPVVAMSELSLDQRRGFVDTGQTDVRASFFFRCYVTDESPFLGTKTSPSYDGQTQSAQRRDE